MCAKKRLVNSCATVGVDNFLQQDQLCGLFRCGAKIHFKMWSPRCSFSCILIPFTSQDLLFTSLPCLAFPRVQLPLPPLLFCQHRRHIQRNCRLRPEDSRVRGGSIQGVVYLELPPVFETSQALIITQTRYNKRVKQKRWRWLVLLSLHETSLFNFDACWLAARHPFGHGHSPADCFFVVAVFNIGGASCLQEETKDKLLPVQGRQSICITRSSDVWRSELLPLCRRTDSSQPEGKRALPEHSHFQHNMSHKFFRKTRNAQRRVCCNNERIDHKTDSND